MRIRFALTILAAALLADGFLTGSTKYQLPTWSVRGTVRPVADVSGPVPDRRALGRADTAFGLGLLDRLDSSGGNVVISPTSLATGLGMAYLGAGGPTATAMARTLCLPATGPALDAGLRGRATGLHGLAGDRLTLAVRDTVWADATQPINRGYLDRVATGYDAGVRRLTISSAPEQARQAINQAVSDDTRGHIPELLPAGRLDRTIGWVLTDAVYLKAGWARPFDPHETQPGTFHPAAGGATNPRFLRAPAVDYRYARTAGWTAVALPYAGDRLEMLALLPDRPGTRLTTDALDRIDRDLAPTRIDLALPRVDLSYHAELQRPLRALGMGPAFDPGADFTPLSPTADRLAFVQHAATLAVGERGTEAAAATAVGVELSLAREPTQPVVFDHPYLMLIRDRQTGEPLFLARVNDPTRT